MRTRSFLTGLSVVGVAVWLASSLVYAGVRQDAPPRYAPGQAENPESKEKARENPERAAQAMSSEEALKQLVGNWNVEIRTFESGQSIGHDQESSQGHDASHGQEPSYGQDPSHGQEAKRDQEAKRGQEAEPTVSKGKAKIAWVIEGLVLQEELSCKLASTTPDGKREATEFKGICLTGYDSANRTHTIAWGDNFAGALFLGSGQSDSEGKRVMFASATNQSTFDLARLKDAGAEQAGATEQVVRMEAEFVDKDTRVVRMFRQNAGEEYRVMEITYTRR